MKKKNPNSISVSQKSVTCPYLILWQPRKCGLELSSHYLAIRLQNKNLCWKLTISAIVQFLLEQSLLCIMFFFTRTIWLGVMRKDLESFHKLPFQETQSLVNAFIWSFLNMQYVQQATKHEIYSVTQDHLHKNYHQGVDNPLMACKRIPFSDLPCCYKNSYPV